jgi:hypothetical protein
MTMVLPQRDLRRSGSFLITSGLYEGKFKVSAEGLLGTYQVFCKNGVRPRTPMRTPVLMKGYSTTETMYQKVALFSNCSIEKFWSGAVISLASISFYRFL